MIPVVILLHPPNKKGPSTQAHNLNQRTFLFFPHLTDCKASAGVCGAAGHVDNVDAITICNEQGRGE